MQFSNRLNVGHVFILLQAYFVKVMPAITLPARERYGMTDDFDMVAMETVSNQYLGGDTSLVCSAETQKEIDKKIVETVKKQHEKARRLLTENRDKLDELANYLYEKETITGNEFMAILNGKDGAAI